HVLQSHPLSSPTRRSSDLDELLICLQREDVDNLLRFGGRHNLTECRHHVLDAYYRQDGPRPQALPPLLRLNLLKLPLEDGTEERSEEHTSELQSRENLVCR